MGYNFTMTYLTPVVGNSEDAGGSTPDLVSVKSFYGASVIKNESVSIKKPILWLDSQYTANNIKPESGATATLESVYELGTLFSSSFTDLAGTYDDKGFLGVTSGTVYKDESANWNKITCLEAVVKTSGVNTNRMLYSCTSTENGVSKGYQFSIAKDKLSFSGFQTKNLGQAIAVYGEDIIEPNVPYYVFCRYYQPANTLVLKATPLTADDLGTLVATSLADDFGGVNLCTTNYGFGVGRNNTAGTESQRHDDLKLGMLRIFSSGQVNSAYAKASFLQCKARFN